MDGTKYKVELTLSQLMQIVEKNDSRVEICLDCKHVFYKKKMCPKCKCESSAGSFDRYCGEARWQSILNAANITEADIAKGVIDLIHGKYKAYETSENE